MDVLAKELVSMNFVQELSRIVLLEFGSDSEGFESVPCE